MTSHEHRPTVRFYEVDQQGVIYHMWYHAYFEDARNELLSRCRASLPSIQARGLDLQVVAFELGWQGPVRWGDDLRVDVAVRRIGTTSLDIDYSASVDGDCRVTGTATYVLVSRAAKQPAPWPADLREALSPDGAS